MAAALRSLRMVAKRAPAAAFAPPQQALRAAPAALGRLLGPAALGEACSTRGGCGALSPAQGAATPAAVWQGAGSTATFASIPLSRPPRDDLDSQLRSSSNANSSGSSGSGGMASPANGSGATTGPASLRLQQAAAACMLQGLDTKEAAGRLAFLRELGVPEHVLVDQQQHERVALAPQRAFRVEAQYVGSRLSLLALSAHPELEGRFQRLHKGALVLGLSPGSAAAITDAAEAEVRGRNGGGGVGGAEGLWELRAAAPAGKWITELSEAGPAGPGSTGVQAGLSMLKCMSACLMHSLLSSLLSSPRRAFRWSPTWWHSATARWRSSTPPSSSGIGISR